jgi:hypothetical protein
MDVVMRVMLNPELSVQHCPGTFFRSLIEAFLGNFPADNTAMLWFHEGKMMMRLFVQHVVRGSAKFDPISSHGCFDTVSGILVLEFSQTIVLVVRPTYLT